jgi:CubicO group peptidase (beta-lactamase class C family)
MSTLADATPQVLNQAVISYVESLRLAWKVPGLAIGILRSDGVTETHGWGIKNSFGDPVTAETLFGIGSCTKAFLSTAIGIILEKSEADTDRQGPALTWRTPVKSSLPNEWALRDEFADSQATISDILSHQSGLPRHDFMYSLGDDTADILRRLRFLKPTSGLREEYQYNNLVTSLTCSTHTVWLTTIG